MKNGKSPGPDGFTIEFFIFVDRYEIFSLEIFKF